MTDEITPLLALAMLVGPAVGAAALMTRIWAVDALQALGLFEKLGKPRRFFFY